MLRIAVNQVKMDELSDEEMHPNWVALATVKFRPKIFVKSSGTEDDRNETEKAATSRVEIDESASVIYNEILQMPSTAAAAPKVTRSNPRPSRRRVKIEKTPFDKQALFKLSLANDYEGIQKLVNRSIKPDVNATDAFGWTALMMAACEGAVHSFQKLLELGADLDAADRKGDTATSLAEQKGFQEILEVVDEYNKQTGAIEISDDDGELSEGTQFCTDCGIEISRASSTSHKTSTVHLFSCKFKGNMNHKTFGIARTNLGFKMMRRVGWDGNSALGARQNGKLYPIKTVMRKMRTGLGIEQDPARITHFKPNDPSSIRFKPQPRAPTRKEIHENDLKDKRRDQRLRRELT